MRSAIQLLALLAPLAFVTAKADQATSANYSIALSIEAGGGRITSSNYAQDVVITTLSGRSVATFSDVIALGFATRFNNPPIAFDDVRSHPPDTAINLTTSSLLANDFEPEGDTVSIIAADATSAAGATVAFDGQTLVYTPPAGLLSSDHFKYTIADANGDVATATVTMVIAPPIANQPLNTVTLTPQSDGKMLVRFRQQPGANDYVIEFTNDLNSEWLVLQDVHARADGIVELLIDPSLNEQTFFRAVVY
jgi:hypothetical protein